MFADFLPVGTMDFHQFHEKFIFFLLPSIFGSALKSTITTIAHFGVAPRYQFGELIPVHVLLIPQKQKFLIFLFSPRCLARVVASFPQILDGQVQAKVGPLSLPRLKGVSFFLLILDFWQRSVCLLYLTHKRCVEKALGKHIVPIHRFVTNCELLLIKIPKFHNLKFEECF